MFYSDTLALAHNKVTMCTHIRTHTSTHTWTHTHTHALWPHVYCGTTKCVFSQPRLYNVFSQPRLYKWCIQVTKCTHIRTHTCTHTREHTHAHMRYSRIFTAFDTKCVFSQPRLHTRYMQNTFLWEHVLFASRLSARGGWQKLVSKCVFSHPISIYIYIYIYICTCIYTYILYIVFSQPRLYKRYIQDTVGGKELFGMHVIITHTHTQTHTLSLTHAHTHT